VRDLGVPAATITRAIGPWQVAQMRAGEGDQSVLAANKRHYFIGDLVNTP
jgi:hypothetical protein